MPYDCEKEIHINYLAIEGEQPLLPLHQIQQRSKRRKAHTHKTIQSENKTLEKETEFDVCFESFDAIK